MSQGHLDQNSSLPHRKMQRSGEGTPEDDHSGEEYVIRDEQWCSGFITTNPQGLLPFAEYDNTSTEPTTDTQSSKTEPEHASIQALGRPNKRRGSFGSEERIVKRQIPPPTTPSPSPFQTLRATRLDVMARNTVPKHYEVDYYMEQLISSNGITASQQSLHRTTMDYLTPCPTYNNNDHDALHLASGASNHAMPQLQLEDRAGNFNLIASRHLETHADSIYHREECPISDTLEGSDTTATAWAEEADEYDQDDSLEEDMLLLAERADIEAFESHIPSSSVVRHMDRDSRSISDYDPNLQHSSQSNSPDQDSIHELRFPEGDNSPVSDDLLDEDVDWDAVLTLVRDSPKEPSLMGSRDETSPQGMQASVRITSDNLSQSTLATEEKKLNFFARPPFPHKAGSPIPGLSYQSVLQTCFRLSHLINQATHCHRNQQDAIFELYARVTYSSREPMATKQHFQFVDLLSDRQPCITGILTGWRVGSLLDQQSHWFIAAAKPKFCWCICKVHRDVKASVGWKMEVKEIREATWDAVQDAKLTLCGEEVEEGQEDDQMLAKLPVL